MPIIKIQNNLSGDNKGSCKSAVIYLQKEERFRDKSQRKGEEFFNQFAFNFDAKNVIKKIDTNRQGLKKGDAKYFSLTIAPSQKELAELSDEALKNYAIDFMKLYAAHFDKGIDEKDLVWFGKMEHTRKYKGYSKGKNEQLPSGKKSGEFKPGDQRHIHILVRRKTEKNIKLSPLANARNSTTNFGKGTKIGFDRVEFFGKADILMAEKIQKINPKHNITSDSFFSGRFLKSVNFDYKKGKEIGINDEFINAIKELQRRNPKELERLKWLKMEAYYQNRLKLIAEKEQNQSQTKDNTRGMKR